MTTSTLKPGEILRDTLQRIGPIFLPVALLAVPGVLITMLVSNPMLAGLINVVYLFLVAPILGGAMIILVNRCLTGQQTDLGEAVAMAWRKAVPLILTMLLLLIILIPALMLLVIPGLYLSVRLFATQYEVVLGHKSPTEALSASWELTRGRWWSIFWTMLVVSLAFVVPLLIASAILGAVLPFGVVISNLLGIVVTPPLVMALMMIYKVVKGESAMSADGADIASA
ncbi:glycerophosphoryl diester phosphodiesterase membrane domain-containing protein [Leptothoe spongobia]|uniref:Glycerophosphoryl diester phosphodiesterase membrane domain-containing protein n=1 Tax=Leptothoe spongobia TAU-MAC 1115 TaxID=1967444 RepID=A0A947DD63_9CYAN|nr:glycerophosphoryl diester phosphodiesterase membrane domain-containing protein [Leptothoe spongobia]MBT9314344.1 glycerophosphoryl diester phosphodiesterase membrane domain-containing protein [Leptothoe spongobia TAU-MAC 1115]